MRILILMVISLAASPALFASNSLGAAARRPLEGVRIHNTATSIRVDRVEGDRMERILEVPSARVVVQEARLETRAAVAPVRIPNHLRPAIERAAKLHGVDANLIATVAAQESAFNPKAVSPVGAMGVMQLMPGTARELGVDNPFDPEENIEAGTRYLKRMLQMFHGNLDMALAAYNAGPGAVRKHGGIPPYAETRHYVASIRARYSGSR